MLIRLGGFAIAAGTTTTAGQGGGDANQYGSGQRQAEGVLCGHGFRGYEGNGGMDVGTRGCSGSWGVQLLTPSPQWWLWAEPLAWPCWAQGIHRLPIGWAPVQPSLLAAASASALVA